MIGVGFTGWLAGAPASASAAPTLRPDCERSGRTVAANQYARVFFVGHRRDHIDYVCSLRDRQVRELDRSVLTPIT